MNCGDSFVVNVKVWKKIEVCVIVVVVVERKAECEVGKLVGLTSATISAPSALWACYMLCLQIPVFDQASHE